MKLLIDIPEHIYEHAKETTEDSRDEFDAMRAIANGTQQESRSEIPNTCGDAISRQAVIELCDVRWLDDFAAEVRTLPSVTPQQKTGRWIDDEFGSKCSCCGIYTHLDRFDMPIKSKCCSMCGAKMEAEE